VRTKIAGNPLQENCEEGTWRGEAAKRLPLLKKLDGETVIREEGVEEPVQQSQQQS
jgi:hypothetical protein